MTIRRPLVVAVALGLLAAPRSLPAQDPPAAGEPTDPATKYKFVEHYQAPGGPATPGAIGQYRAAFRETRTSKAVGAAGESKDAEITYQMVFTERPAEVSSVDPSRVGAVVRRYEGTRLKPALPATLPNVRPFEDLTILYRLRPGRLPEIVSLMPGRPMVDSEYYIITSQIFVPSLALTLPEVPVRVGETYAVSPEGSGLLMGQVVRQGQVMGKLQEIRPGGADDPRQVAVFDLTGSLAAEAGQAAVHAQIQFAFTPDRPVAAAGLDTVDAPGQIIRVSLAQQTNLRGTAGRPVAQDGEFLFQRRTNDPGAPITIPDPLPEPSPENSWPTYVDRKGRFRVNHPPDFPPNPATILADSGSLIFDNAASKPEPADEISLFIRPAGRVDPDALAKERLKTWEKERMKVTPGEAGPRPAAEWPGRKVHRYRVALDLANGLHVYHELYVIQFDAGPTLEVEALTNQDPPTPFRQSVEAMLKTFQYLKSPATPPPASRPGG